MSIIQLCSPFLIAMQVEFDKEAVTATLSWERKEVEVPDGSAEVVYTVLASSDEAKQDSKEVYKSVSYSLHKLLSVSLSE